MVLTVSILWENPDKKRIAINFFTYLFGWPSWPFQILNGSTAWKILIRNTLYGDGCMHNTAKMRLISLLMCLYLWKHKCPIGTYQSRLGRFPYNLYMTRNQWNSRLIYRKTINIVEHQIYQDDTYNTYDNKCYNIFRWTVENNNVTCPLSMWDIDAIKSEFNRLLWSQYPHHRTYHWFNKFTTKIKLKITMVML